jgi:hypothetical protein
MTVQEYLNTKLVFAVVNAFIQLEIHAFKHGPWEKKCECVFFDPPVVFWEEGGIALISIRFYGNLKIICSHCRQLWCDFIFCSHESSHASGDISNQKWAVKNPKCNRVFFFGGLLDPLPRVAVSQRFWTWRMPMFIFCSGCCSSTYKNVMVVRMVGASFCLTGLLPLFVWRWHDDDDDDAQVTTILELIIWALRHTYRHMHITK